jgi:hypothetical protein
LSDDASRHRAPAPGASPADPDGRPRTDASRQLASKPGTPPGRGPRTDASRQLASEPGTPPGRGPLAGSDRRDRSAAGRYRAGIELPERVDLVVDGRPVPAYPGESLAAALFAAGIRATRRTASGALRGPYCNMGVCFECLVTVDGVPAVRSCTVPVRSGLRVATDR